MLSICVLCGGVLLVVTAADRWHASPVSVSFYAKEYPVPVYEYVCGDCQHEYEELVFDDDEVVVCPKCKSAKTMKVLSAFAFKCGSTFRGSSKSDGCSGCGHGHGGCSGCKH